MGSITLERIVDTTLREGEQTPTVYFKPEEKCVIAELLHHTLGRKALIEVGQPYNPKYRPGVEAVVRRFDELGYHDARLLIHCRTLREDVEIAWKCGGWGAVVVLAPSDKHLMYKLNGLPYAQALERIRDVIKFAKESVGFQNVQYTLEDATSMPLEKIKEVVVCAREAGADIIRIPDTKGQADFEFMRRIISGIREVSDVPLDVHCHNDRGMAVANALSGLSAGATGVHVSVMGLGERCGITDLATFVENAETLYGLETGVNFKLIPKLYNYVSAVSGIPIPLNTPILGVFARTHKAGEHQKSVLQRPDTYETIDFEKYGLQRDYEFGAMQSKQLIETLLRGLDVPTSVKAAIVERIRETSMEKGRPLRRPEVWRIIEEATGITPEQARLASEEPINALIFIKVKPACDELNLIKGIREKFLEHSIPIRIRDISGHWDYIIDAWNIQSPALLDRLTADIRRQNRAILETSTSIVFDEYK